MISVIVPIYKVEKYLARCLQTLLSQSFVNIEIILVNDGSPDNCGSICDEYSLLDPRVIVVHKKNGGPSDARNTGIYIASGEFLTFVDSDDYISNNFIQALYDSLIANNADMSYSNYQLLDNMCNLLNRTEEVFHVKDEVFTGSDGILLLCQRDPSFYVMACGKLYRKHIFDSITFPVGKGYEDVFTAHRICAKCKRIVAVSSAYYYYVQNPNSIMHNQNNTRQINLAEAYFDLAKCAETNHLFEFAGKWYYSAAMLVSEIFENKLNCKDKMELEKLLIELRRNFHIISYCKKKEVIHLLFIIISPIFHNFIIKHVHGHSEKWRQLLAGSKTGCSPKFQVITRQFRE